jgi:hypothetical protein
MHNIKSRYVVNNKLPGWHYCFVNDSHEGWNLQRYLDAGYVFDNDESSAVVQRGETVHPDHSKQSSKSYATKQGSMRMYLMRQPIELHKEDLLAKTGRDDSIMESVFGANQYSYLKNQTKIETDTRIKDD